MILTVVTFLLVLSVLVFAHEMGHFLTARKFGVKAEEFGLGFPPRAFGVYKNVNGKWITIFGNKEVSDSPGTIYSLNWIPLGGFVKIKGENGDNVNEADSFASKKIWQRAVMLSAGVTMNVILAAALISFGLMIGLPQAVDGLSPKAQVSQERVQIVDVMPGSPAEKAQVKIGDFILSINGEQFKTEKAMQDYVGTRAGQELEYKISRMGEEVILKIAPEMRQDTGRAGIGVAIGVVGLVKYPWYLAIWEGVRTTFLFLWLIIVAFYQLLKNLIIGNGVTAEIAGPVGIATITGQFAHMGFVYLLNFTAILSINLAILNIFPFPALDGGRILFLIIEKIKGSPVKREFENAIHNIGFIILMIFVLFVTFKDISKIGGGFRAVIDKII